MNRLPLILGGTLLVLGSALAGFMLARHQHAPAPGTLSLMPVVPPVQNSMLGKPRPDFSLPDTDGRTRDVSEWDGRVLALNFWATWCPPCRKEIPEFVALQDKYGPRGLQVVGIAMQEPGEVTGFMRELGMNYPVLAGEMDVAKVAESFGDSIGALPFTVIVDRRGNIAFVRTGPLSGPDAERAISPLL